MAKNTTPNKNIGQSTSPENVDPILNKTNILHVSKPQNIDCNAIVTPKTINTTDNGNKATNRNVIKKTISRSTNPVSDVTKVTSATTLNESDDHTIMNRGGLKINKADVIVNPVDRIIETDKSVIVDTSKTVIINTYENITEQKYINNISCCGGGGSSIQVGSITGSTFSLVNNTTQLGFDTDSGFDVTDLGSGLTKIGMNSTFKCWEIDGNPGLVASGLDTVNFVAGSGVTITSCNTTVPKTLTISATGGGGTPGGSNGQIQFNNAGSLGGNCGLTYCSTTCAIGLSNITVPINTNLQINVSNNEAYWYAEYGDMTFDVNDDYSSQVVFDTQGNIYIIGADGNNGVPYIIKYDPTGTVLWQQEFTDTNNYYKTGDAVATDSNDNVYCIVGTDDSVNLFTVFKFDSDGNLLWSNDVTGTDWHIGLDINVDSSGNVYVSGYVSPVGSDVALLMKFSTSGSLVWQKYLNTGIGYASGLTIDSSGNIFITSRCYPFSADEYLVVAKYDPSGNVVWQKAFSDSGYYIDAGQITCDISGNIYIAGTYNYGDGMYVIKLDSSGAIIWQTNLVGQNECYGVAIDVSGNVYINGVTYSAGAGNQDLYIAKLSSSGNVLWQRTFGGVAVEYPYYYWAYKTIDVLDNSYVITGYTYSPNLYNGESLVIKLPTDGTLTNVYGSFTYQEANLASNSTQFTVSTSSFISADGSLSSVAGSINVSTASGISTLVKISGGSNTYVFNSNGSFTTPGFTLPYSIGNSGDSLLTSNTNTICWGKPPIVLNNQYNFLVRESNYIPAGSSNSVNNIGIGQCVLWCNAAGGGCNIAIGDYALLQNTIGQGNLAIGRYALVGNCCGNANTAIGYGASQYACNGTLNTAIGPFALAFGCGCNNVGIGWRAGCNSTLGCNNVFIGCASLAQTTTANNTITLGNSEITCIRAQVTTISALSDQRDKTNVEDLPLGLQFILDLRPVKFTWNMRDGGKVGVEDSGFIAQEVAALEDHNGVTQWLDMVGRENPDKLEVKPGKLIPVLVKAIQDMHEKFTAEIENLKAEIATLKGSN